MPLFGDLLELIGRLFYVPQDLFAAATTPFTCFNFNDRADWVPIWLILSSLQILVVCRLKHRQYPTTGWLAFGFSMAVSCLVPVFMYFAGWYWQHGNSGGNIPSFPHAARFLLGLLIGGDTHFGDPRLVSRRSVCTYCYAWMGWSANTCLLFFVLGWKRMTKRQRLGAFLLFLAPWVLYDLFFPSSFEYWIF